LRDGADEEAVEVAAARAEDGESAEEEMDAFGFGEAAEVGDEGEVVRDVEFVAERGRGGGWGGRFGDEIEDGDGAGVVVKMPAAGFGREHEDEGISAAAGEGLEESAAEAEVAGVEAFEDVEDDGAAGARGGGEDAGEDDGIDVNEVWLYAGEEGACGVEGAPLAGEHGEDAVWVAEAVEAVGNVKEGRDVGIVDDGDAVGFKELGSGAAADAPDEGLEA